MKTRLCYVYFDEMQIKREILMFVNLFFLLLKYKSFEPLFVSATDSTMDW